MSADKAVNLMLATPKALLLSIDEKTGRQNAVSLIAYGQDAADENATLLFTTNAPHVYQEIKLAMPFDTFDMIMNRSDNLSVQNVEQSPAQINPNSALGVIITNFKAHIAAVMHHPTPQGMS